MSDPKFWVPYLRWDAFVADRPAESGGDADTDPEKKGINGGVTITASLSKGDVRAVRAFTDPEHELFALGQQEARLDDGQLKLTALQTEFGLLGKSSILDLPEDVDLIYTFRPHHVTYNGKPQDLPTITVKAPEIPDAYDPVVSGPFLQNLADLEWLDASTAFAGGFIIRQVPDDVVSALGDTAAQFLAQGVPVGDPLVLPSAAWNSILGKPAVIVAAATGTTADRAALAAADTAAQAAGIPVLLPAGTYRVATALTITSPVIAQPGAKIKPDSGVTVNMPEDIRSPRRQIFDTSAGGKVVVPKTTTSYAEWWGAVGDSATDDGVALKAMLQDSALAAGGAKIVLDRVYATSSAVLVQSNTHVSGSGTIKCLVDAPGARGFVVGILNGVHDIVWDGPTVDGNLTHNANCIALGDNDNSYPWVENIYINATVKGARIDTGIETSTPLLFAGGGKGFSPQFRCRNVYAIIRAEDCDIAATLESATTVGEDRAMENFVLDLQSYNSHRTALYLSGGTPQGVGSAVSAGYQHGRFPGVKVRLYAQGGQDSEVIDVTTGIAGPNYGLVGVVTCQGACGFDLEVKAVVQERATLIRGKLFASHVKINALMDNLEDLWDSRPLPGLAGTFVNMMDNVVEANVHASTHSGVLVRAHRVSGSRTLRRSILDIAAWCENGVGGIAQSDGTTDEFGPSVAYRFRDMKSTPVKEVVGMSTFDPLPTWALAPLGGRVAVQRESWMRMGWNEAPLVWGSAGTARRFLWWDNTTGLMRIAATAPASETAGDRLGTWTKTTATTTATLAATPGNRYITLLGAGAVVTLPTAVGNESVYVLKNIDSSSKTILTTSSQTVEGTTLVLPPASSAELVSDGSNWRIL